MKVTKVLLNVFSHVTLTLLSHNPTLLLSTIILHFAPFLAYVHPRLRHTEMTTWSTACTQEVLLFRVLGKQDDASQGICPRNPYASLSIDEHVVKGPNSRIGSQYISTTLNLELAMKTNIKRRSELAIIFCIRLDKAFMRLDLSSGHSELTPVNSVTTIQLSKVLFYSYINSSAMVVFTYSELIHFCFICSLSIPCRDHNSLADCFSYWIADYEHDSLLCTFCGDRGHLIVECLEEERD
ncbi:MAG: hypothetical protein JOS17DRAFT_188493 [Linnemannia elongata]|nr:MAG: hypothetical protein JOS17DRAFT_188493 [Linnemannia elongata]